MGLDRLIQSATAIAEDNSSTIENAQAEKPPLRLVQGGLANSPDAGLEQKEVQRFHLTGVDRVGGLTILRGEVDGEPRAIVTHVPPELLLPPEAGRPDTAFERIRAGAFGKIAAVLALVGAGAAAMAGCAPDNKPKIGSNSAALSAADVDNLGAPALTNWTEFGDGNNGLQISDIDGTTVIIFGRGGDLYSVSCAELEDCLTTGEPVTIEASSGYATGVPYQTLEGVNKLIYQTGTLIRQRDVVYDAASGTFTITGSSETFSPSMAGGMSYMKVAGVPHLLWGGGVSDVNLRNLYTDEDTLLELDGGPMAICDQPHQSDGGIALGSFLYDPGAGSEYCRLISAPTLNELLDNFIEGSIPSGDGVSRTSPRSLGNVLIYVQEDAGGTRIYYAVAPIVPLADGGDPTPDSGPGAGDSGPDAGDSGPGGGDGPGTDADAGTGEGPEAGIDPEDDSGPGDDADASEGEEEDAGPDTDGPTTPREDGGDTPKPDADEGESEGEDELSCDLGVGGASVTVIEQNCTFSDCDNSNNDGDVTINGNCTVEIDLGSFGNGTPVTLTIDGEYTINILEQIAGQLVSGLFQADTGGNDFRSAYGAFVLAPEGTVYGGEGQTRMPSTDPSHINMSQHPEFHVFVAEGRVTVFFNGEEVMTLGGGEEYDFSKGGPNAEDPNQPGCGACDLANGGPSSNALGFALFALAAALKKRQGRSKKRK